MNKAQYDYDLVVQVRNKEHAVDQLKKREAKLEVAKRIIKVQGQVDKVRNKREHTLFEYRKKIAECEKEKLSVTRKLKYLRKKLLPPKPVDNTDHQKN